MNDSTWTLRDGTIADGTGRPLRQGNVVVADGRIISIGGDQSEGTVIDVEGMIVSPGFVDIHSHVDWILPMRDAPEVLAPIVLQGITTAAGGNCGISPAPLSGPPSPAVERLNLAGTVADRISWEWQSLSEYFACLERLKLPFNLCMYIGHSTLRAGVVGEAQRPPTARELLAMQGMLEDGLRDGAVGLSIGLEYFPGRYAGPSEVVALASLLPAHDAVLAAHTRGISALFVDSITEGIAIAETAACRLQLAHVNPMGAANWDGVNTLFALIKAARNRSLDIGYDVVAYVTWTLAAIDLLPYFIQELGRDAVLALAARAEGRDWLQERIEHSLPTWPPWVGQGVTRNVIMEMGWDALVLADPASADFRADRGQSLGAIARARGRSPFEVYFDLLVASNAEAQIVNIGYGGNFEDESALRTLMSQVDAVPETDTVPVRKPNGSVHLPLPMFHGTMARFLGYFCRDLGLMPLETAVHRITALPARRLRLPDRGVLQEGAYADITVFDPRSIGDRGDHLDPLPPAGIEHVFVNGKPVVRDGVYDPERLTGRLVRRQV